MKRNKLILIMIMTCLLIVGCASGQYTKLSTFPKTYDEKPLTILVLPPVNVSTSALAKEYLTCTLAEPITNRGYYVIPIEVSNKILQNEGLYDTETITPGLYPKFKELFNADAVIIPKILKWDTNYFVVSGNVTVSLEYALISTTTGETLWSYSGTQIVDTTEKAQGAGLGNLIVAAATTAVRTAATDYIPIAKQVNLKIFETLPAGKYSPRYMKDQNDRVKQ